MGRISKLRMKKKLFICNFSCFLLFTIILSSCISIKSDYPTIYYYNLHQEASEFKNIVTVKGSLQIRNFTAIDEFYLENIQTQWDDGSIQKYFYHRWVADPPDMVTDFIVVRMNNLKAFSKGAVKSNTILLPDFILEGNLLEFNSFSSNENKPNSNYVKITIAINLIKRPLTKSDTTEHIFHKVYSNVTYRDNNSVKSIPVAFSKCLSYITDLIIQDVQQVIVKESIIEAE